MSTSRIPNSSSHTPIRQQDSTPTQRTPHNSRNAPTRETERRSESNLRHDQYREMESRNATPDFDDEIDFNEVGENVGVRESVDADSENAHARQMNHHIVEKQTRSLEASIRGANLKTEEKENFRETIQQINSDHRSGNMSLEEAIDALTDVKKEMSAAVKANKQEAVEAVSSDISDFKNDLKELQQSKSLSKTEVDGLKKKAQDILDRVKNDKLSLKDAQTELEKLKTSVNDGLTASHDQKKNDRTTTQDKVVKSMDLIMRLGNLWASDKAKQISTLIKNAIRNNSWDAVNSALGALHKNDANNVVQYLVGAVYQETGKNEAEFMKALNVFPKQIREKMIEKVTEDSGEIASEENMRFMGGQAIALDKTQEEADAYWRDGTLTYWTPSGTADMISRSMGTENEEQYRYLTDAHFDQSEPAQISVSSDENSDE
ncbi:MAG: hypothetical protein U1F57_00060 [bacterium]